MGENSNQKRAKSPSVWDYNIKRGLKEIPENDYNNTFWFLFEKRKKAVGGINPLTQKKKIISYMVYRGWETQKIYEALQDL